MQPADDHALLRQFVESHSDEAFAGLVERYVNLVYSVALRQTGGAADAEEITQAVFIVLAKKAGELRHDKAISSWLFQATRLTANNFIRSEMRRHRREQEASMQSVLNEPEDMVWRRIAPVLDDAVTALGEKDRRAIILRFYEGRNLREVGAVLGASEDAAEKRVSRALEKLRRFFFKRGVDSTTTALAGAISAHSIHAAPMGLAKTISAVALGKGVVASTSTLTLARGALKVMAWSKTKTAITSVVAALLGIGTTAILADALWPRPDIQGIWEGSYVISDSAGVHRWQLPRDRLVLTITETNGVYQASWDNLDEGIKDEKFDAFTYTYPYVHAAVSNMNTSCTARVGRFGNTIYWKTVENKTVHSMVLTRTTHPTPFPEPLADAEFAPRSDSALQGFWVGKIAVGKKAIRIEAKIAEAPDGTFRADFYVPDEATNRLPATVNYDGVIFKLMPTAGFGIFEGWLRNGSNDIVGNWIEADNRLRTTLTRTDYSEYEARGAK
jgi:RNA polymerase sigma factor (sigma-70 family)